MHRIDHETAATDPITGEPMFTEGDPETQIAATVVTADWLNAVQEEIANAVVLGAAPLDKQSNNQLALALSWMFETLAIGTMRASTGLLTNATFALAEGMEWSFLVIACDSSVMRYSLDGGLTGTDCTLEEMGGAHPNYRDVASGTDGFDNPRFVVVGDGGLIRTSEDGINWTARVPDADYTDSFRAVHYAAALGLWIAVGDAGEVQTSPDGITWTHQTGMPAVDYFCVTSGDDKLLITGGASADFTIVRSPNGVNWFVCDVPVAPSSLFLAISPVPRGYLALTAGALYRSTDGLSWAKSALSWSFAALVQNMHINPRTGFIAGGSAGVGNLILAIPTGDSYQEHPVWPGTAGAGQARLWRTPRRYYGVLEDGTAIVTGIILY